jgi:porphobilinogen synthase
VLDLLTKRNIPTRLRRLRETAAMREMLRETRLAPRQLVAPIVVIPGTKQRDPIAALTGHSRLTPDLVVAEARRLAELGVGGILLFGVPRTKDEMGQSAANPSGPVPEALRQLRDAALPLVLMADVCMCGYTTHGHCGVFAGGGVDNDMSLPILATAAAAYAAAGADIVAPSAMMDGQVAAIRASLDAASQTGVAIMAYASKHASALYGPFRDAAASTPAFGDRRSYQMEAGNSREALREMELDVQEGADLLMVKPALTSLDLLARARSRFDLPLAAYQVSGEYAMVQSAGERGWIDARAVALETLTAIVRAGADLIITYFAADAAQWLAGVEPKRPGLVEDDR